MNLNCDTYIKQEFINAEENLLQNVPISDTNILIKNEPITDEVTTPFVSIKTEPPGETTRFLEDTGVIKNENQLSNQIAVPGDSFIIYELETPHAATSNVTPQSTDFPQLNNQIIDNTGPLPAAIVNSPQLVTSIHQSPVMINSIINENSCTFTAPLSTIPAPNTSAPPVLLNAKLRKRNKVIIPVNPMDKRTRYNIEGTTSTAPAHKSTPTNVNNPVKSLNSHPTLNAGNKKIINHLIKRKTIPIITDESNTNLDKSSQKATSIKSTIKANNEHTLTLLTSPESEQISINTQTELNLRLSPPLQNIENPINVVSSPENSMDFKLSFCSSPPSSTSADVPVKEMKNSTEDPPPPPAFTSELRVKCLCSLTAATNNGDINDNDNSELKTFFKQMFEETRRLNKKQQRKVKICLLQAISDAEELMEQGKCCGF
ncbi:uncharacterized protein ACRADG_003778 isoform 1-T2 [Cochliomyia hominivorax]